MQKILGIRGADRQGLQPADDRGMAELQGEAAVAGAMSGVQEGYGKGATSDEQPKLERRGERGLGTGGRRGRQGR